MQNKPNLYKYIYISEAAVARRNFFSRAILSAVASIHTVSVNTFFVILKETSDLKMRRAMLVAPCRHGTTALTEAVIRKINSTTLRNRAGNATFTLRLLSTSASTDQQPKPKQQPFTSSSTSSSSPPVASTHFGFRNVKTEEKENLVRGVFDSVAESYDVMNDVMSAGVHRLWKDYFVQSTRVEFLAKAVRRNSTNASDNDNEEELRILDVAGGTGDIAFRMIDAMQCEERSKSSGKDPVSVTVCDINTEMLRVGQRRARERYGSSLLDDTKALSFIEGNAQSLVKFDDNSFDLYTIAFGLRNVTDVDMALREALRVLKPGGRFMCLEFSHLPHPALQSMYDLYSFNLIPAMGQMVANDRDSYQYLVESIRKFSDQETLVRRMKDAGMQGAKYTNLTGGIVAIHEGWKPLEWGSCVHRDL